MTDSTDEEDRTQADGTALIPETTPVPTDTEWKLAIQVPFDEGEMHDLTSAIIVGIAKADGVTPRQIKDPPLYQILDVTALEEAFFGSSTIGQRSENFRSVEFMYRGYRIVVRSDAWIQVYQHTDE